MARPTLNLAEYIITSVTISSDTEGPACPRRAALRVGNLQNAVPHLLLQNELRILRDLCEHVIESKLAALGNADHAARAQQVDEVLEHGAIEELRGVDAVEPVSYTHLRAHETRHDLVCR